MRDFKEFLSGDVVVTFSSEEEVKDFLKLCESKNVMWREGSRATKFTSILRDEGVRYDKSCGCIWKGTLNNYREAKKYSFVSAFEFLLPKEHIELFRTSNSVVCLKRINDKVVGIGTSYYCPTDKFDFDYNASLAFYRMLGNSNTKPHKIVKQESYHVGDIVLVKKKWKSKIALNKMNFMLGNAYEVVADRGVWSEKDGHSYKLKVCDGEINKIGDYWNVCDSDIKGRVVDNHITIKKDVYEVGDRVLIKKKWKSGKHNEDGMMDQYLGTVMTIKGVRRVDFKLSYVMEEDQGTIGRTGGWYWYHSDIKGKVLE